MLVAVPDGFEAGGIVEQARRANPQIEIVARAHSDDEVAHLVARGADETILGESEIAAAMLNRVISRRQAAKSEEPDATAREILDDAERAVLGGFAERVGGPGEAVS